VVFEYLDESLADHAGRAEYAYVTTFHVCRISHPFAAQRSGREHRGREEKGTALISKVIPRR
jgi:hypothetical protein